MHELNIYPKFIPDKPDGKDLYEGQSQNSLADNICQFIIENDDNNKKVIGVEGEWGSGKSNVIEILRTKLKKDYYFFVFDAWGHQEDLTRRSILEGLLIKLIDDDVLKGEKSSWKDELKNLLSKTIEKQQKNIPQFSWAVILSVIGILLMPITKFITESYLKSKTTVTATPDFGNYIVATLILITSFIPLIIFVIYSIRKAKSGERKNVIRELFYIYKGKEIKNTSFETISEDEPTVLQFSNFLEKLEIGSKRKLVIVFDNMDRLPSTKVKDIWSSIHTFFASEGNQIKSWAIVPFDNDHICNIFNEEDKSKANIKNRADSYIHKTFSIVFHVPPPVLSDWKEFFSTKFKEAFGIAPPIEEYIETIFDYHHITDPKIKPRDIICFVNDLVALKKLWKDIIPFRYLALFALKRMEILQNPFEEIISRKYLGSLTSLFEYDDQLDTIISALSFNVPIEKADEILLKRPIEKALFGEGDLIKISTNKNFFKIFDSVFYSSNLNVSNAISCLESLPPEIREKTEMNNYWGKLSNSVLKVEPFELKYVDAIKTLVRKLKNHNHIERVLKFLFNKAIVADAKGQKLFSGKKYYDLITDIDSLLQEIWPEKNIEDLLSRNLVEAEEYFDFIIACPKTYEKYNVKSGTKTINDFLISKFDNNEISKYLPNIEILKTKDLSGFKTHIEATISSLMPTVSGYAEIITNLYDVGKKLSQDGKLPFAVPESQAIVLLTATPAHSKAIDLLLSIIAANVSNPQPTHTIDTVSQKMLGTITHQESFIQSYSYYFNYTDLIKYHLQFPSALTKIVLKEITKRDSEVTGSDVKFIISKYNQIKAGIFDDDIDLCNSFISKVNSFYSSQDIQFVSPESLTYVIQIIEDNNSVNCALVNDIISQANDFINGLNEATWTDSLKEWETSENILLLRTLLLFNKYSSDKLSSTAAYTSYDEVIKSISKKEIPIPSDIIIWNRFLELLNGNFINIYKDARDELLNYNHSEVTIAELLFFEKGLFQFAKLDEDKKVADDVLRRILIPLASNEPGYIEVLKRNAVTIKKIIEQAHDSIIEFKNSLESKAPEIFNDEEIKVFSDPLLNKAKTLFEELNKTEPVVTQEDNQV